MTDALICSCGCGTLHVAEQDTAKATGGCDCGCGTTATHLSRDEEISQLHQLRRSVDERLEELERADA